MHRMVWVAAAALATACGDGPTEARSIEREQDALFQTDSLSYTIADRGDLYTVDIGATFTNRTGAPVYIVNCIGATGLRLERRNGSTWETMWTPILPACLSAPIVVEAGANRREVVRVVAGKPGTNIMPRFNSGELTGEYRVVWTAMLSSYDPRSERGTPLAESRATSNRFVLLAPK